MSAGASHYPPPGAIVLHDGSHYLFAGPYCGLPGWGTVLPELHSGEFDPNRERVVRMSRLVVVDPPDGLDLADADTANPDTPDWTALTDVLETLRQQASASAALAELRAILDEIKDWDSLQYRATGRVILPNYIRVKIQGVTNP